MVEEKIRDSYKKTEVGIIPDDWSIKQLNDLTSQIGDGIHFTPVYVNKSDFYFINGNNLADGAIAINKDTKCISHEEYIKHRKNLSDRTILMSINGTIGNTAYYKNEKVILGKSACYININSNVNHEFIFYQLQNKYINNFYNNELTGSTIKNLSLRSIRNTPIIIPCSEIEQKYISETLKSTDNLIQSFEKLIEKKKKIKQGTMQQLLTGKNRLSGFNSEWEVKKLGNISDIRTGKKNNEDKSDDGIYPFFVRSQTVERINSYSFDGEAILIPGEGGIGSIYHYIDGKFDYHQRVYKISNFDGILAKYIYYYMKQNFSNYAMQNTVKATVDSLRLPTFEEFEIHYPSSMEEQKLIIKILTELDSEIEALEQKLKKYKKIKQGMMEALLTGRIRLI